MKKTVLILPIVGLVFPALAQEDKKYPPYPDVWGYELPFPEENHRDARLGVYRMENGDVFVTHVKHRVTSVRKDGTCCDFKSSYAGFYFFSREKHDMTVQQFNAFGQQHRANRVGFRDYEKITLQDGDSISRGGTTHPRCYTSFPYYLVKKDSRGEVIARKSLLYLRGKPRERPINPYCEGAAGLSRIRERVDSGIFYFVPLADNTFLVFEPYGNLIIRLDDNLNTKFQDPHVFLVDTEIIEKMAKKLAEEGKYNSQTINDAVAEYLVHLGKTHGRFRCDLDDIKKEGASAEHKRLYLEVKEGKVTTFLSSWAFTSSDPDLRPGYAATCERSLASFRQTKDSKGILLQYQPNQYEQDHAKCKIRIVEGATDIRVYSEACQYECLQLNYNFQKNGEVCKTLH